MMKFLSCVLSACILSLAFKPGIDTLTSLRSDEKKTCCYTQCIAVTNNHDPENQKNDSDCTGKLCNPFQVCSACVFLCFNTPLISIPKFAFASDMACAYLNYFTSSFTPDFWQPPKID